MFQGYDDKFKDMELQKIARQKCPGGCIFQKNGIHIQGDCRAPWMDWCKSQAIYRINMKYKALDNK